ncbi:hypothetical protein THAOC_32105, partial [Thalassiosira oceanica]
APIRTAATGSYRPCHGVHAEPPAAPGGPRKAELSLLQGLLSTSTKRARRAEPTDLRRRISAA